MLKKILITQLFIFLCTALYASGPIFPPLTGPVVDRSGILTKEQVTLLSKKSIDFQKVKGSQIAICTVDSTAPLSIEEYGIKLAERWKIGRAKIDDGVIIIIAKNDRKMRIEVGYGLEHLVTDLRAGRIIDSVMAPEFRKGNFYGGLNSAMDSLISYIKNEDLPEETAGAILPAEEPEEPLINSYNLGTFFMILSFILFIVFIGLQKTLISLVLTYITFSISLYCLGSGHIAQTMIIGAFSMVPFVIIALLVKFAPSGGSSSGSSGSSRYSSSSSSYSSYSSSSSSSSSSYSGGGGSYGGGGASGSW